MIEFIHQVVSGAATGGIYASLAVALVMIYRSTNHINFAQGEMATFSTYVAWSALAAGAPYVVAFVIAIAGAFIGGMIIERVIMRPFERGPHLPVIVVIIGLFVIVNSVAGWIFTPTIKPFPSPFPQWRPLGNLISPHELGSLIVVFAVLTAVYLFFRFTSLGLYMRAVADNPSSSALSGIRVGRMLALGWGLAAAIGAVAGLMAAPVVFLDPNMMGGVLLYAFAAALVGGITSPWGAIVGGFFIGIVENVLGAYVVGDDLKLSVALVIIVGVLIFKPSGLFGLTKVVRV